LGRARDNDCKGDRLSFSTGRGALSRGGARKNPLEKKKKWPNKEGIPVLGGGKKKNAVVRCSGGVLFFGAGGKRRGGVRGKNQSLRRGGGL